MAALGGSSEASGSVLLSWHEKVSYPLIWAGAELTSSWPRSLVLGVLYGSWLIGVLCRCWCLGMHNCMVLAHGISLSALLWTRAGRNKHMHVYRPNIYLLIKTLPYPPSPTSFHNPSSCPSRMGYIGTWSYVYSSARPNITVEWTDWICLRIVNPKRVKK